MTIRTKPVQVNPELGHISSLIPTQTETENDFEEAPRDKQRDFHSLCVIWLVVLALLTGVAMYFGFVTLRRREVGAMQILRYAFLYSCLALILFSWYRYGCWLLRHHRKYDQENFFCVSVAV